MYHKLVVRGGLVILEQSSGEQAFSLLIAGISKRCKIKILKPININMRNSKHLKSTVGQLAANKALNPQCITMHCLDVQPLARLVAS